MKPPTPLLLTAGMAGSISVLAAVFSVDRPTASARLKGANVTPIGSHKGSAVYPVGPAAVAILAQVDEKGNQNPATMKPMDRRAHWQAENERIKFEQGIGQLVPIEECRTQYAEIAKICVRQVSTMADRAERDLRCPPEVVEWLEKEAMSLRIELHSLIGGEHGEHSPSD